jgi:hypothetical protein
MVSQSSSSYRRIFHKRSKLSYVKLSRWVMRRPRRQFFGVSDQSNCFTLLVSWRSRRNQSSEARLHPRATSNRRGGTSPSMLDYIRQTRTIHGSIYLCRSVQDYRHVVKTNIHWGRQTYPDAYPPKHCQP